MMLLPASARVAKSDFELNTFQLLRALCTSINSNADVLLETETADID